MTKAVQVLVLILLLGPTVSRYAEYRLLGFDGHLALRRVVRDLLVLACLIWGGFFGVAP